MEIQVEPVGANEEEIQERILRDREAAEAERLAHEQELEAENIKLDEEIAQEIRGLYCSSRSSTSTCSRPWQK